MFNKLVASDSRAGKIRKTAPGGYLGSLVIHSLLITAAAYAQLTAEPASAEEEEEVTFVEIEPEAPQEPEPPPPEVAPPPQGFQELLAPIDIPSIIPDIGDQVAIDVSDFSGVGEVAGISGIIPMDEAVRDTFAFDIGVLEAIPALANQQQVVSIMERSYPRLLLNAGIGGTVTLQFVIENDGTIEEETVRIIDATHEEFRAAAVQAIQAFRFTPGRYRGENVRVLIQMPLTWQVP